jgi:pimeloyl-ACP methyl ester carboxylesterase
LPASVPGPASLRDNYVDLLPHELSSDLSDGCSVSGLSLRVQTGQTVLSAIGRRDHGEWKFAEAYLRGEGPPALIFNVDDVLSRNRNVWLPVYHIEVNTDYSMFAPGLRKSKATAEDSLKQLAESWEKNQRTFDQILKHELSSYGPAMRYAVQEVVKRSYADFASDDPPSVLNMTFGLQNRYKELATLFAKRAVSGKDVSTFLDWKGTEQQPAHKIFAYLMAALGWRVSSGQKPQMSADILNNFTAAAMINFYGGAGTFASWPPRLRAYAVETTPVNILDWASGYGFLLPEASLATLKIPLLVICGGKSPAAVQRANGLLCELTPNATLATIDGAAHFVIATHAVGIASRIAAHVLRAEAELKSPA